ncbi:MAG TPA: anti-sigma F factor [Gammaproteobacteria bacterium]|nr:anti-sigma F factor [Gammaproteobacteria bacterium]
MRTDALIALLATGEHAFPQNESRRRLALALGVGLFAALAATVSLLGISASLARDAQLPLFWAKVSLPLLLVVAGFLATLRLSRPGARLAPVPLALATPFVFIWGLAGQQILVAEAGQRLSLVLGNTWLVCPWLIALLSLPALCALLWAMKGLAPTRLRLAGAAAGLLAGAIGALAYTLHCPELAAPFIGIWYVLGMLIPAAVGALLGPRLLAW